MNSKIVETGPGQNLLPAIKEADQADHLFIAADKLLQWSVSQKKVTNDYGDIMAGDIMSMVQTSDKKYLFLWNAKGF
jgi:hypothetical protein